MIWYIYCCKFLHQLYIHIYISSSSVYSILHGYTEMSGGILFTYQKISYVKKLYKPINVYIGTTKYKYEGPTLERGGLDLTSSESKYILQPK